MIPFSIGPGQVAYVDGTFIGESERLISDIIEVCDLEKLSAYLMATDFEKSIWFYKQ